MGTGRVGIAARNVAHLTVSGRGDSPAAAVDVAHHPDPEKCRVHQRRDDIVALVRERAYEYRDQEFRLSSGEMSHDYIDAKRAVASFDGSQIVTHAIVSLIEDLGLEWEAVGGLTLGADPIAIPVRDMARKLWFSVRKEAKSHGKQKLVEGAELTSGMRVVVVDDVVTTGKSILQALDALDAIGVEVVLAVTLVDRGDTARPRIEARGIRYEPLATYADLGFQPVGSGLIHA